MNIDLTPARESDFDLLPDDLMYEKPAPMAASACVE